MDGLLLARAEQEPDAPLFSLTELDEPVSRGAYAMLAGRAAAVLADHGIGRGDRIAVWAENSLAWLVLLAAAAWRGAALVTLHPALTDQELADALARSRPAMLFVAEQIRSRPGPTTVAKVLAETPPARPRSGWHPLLGRLGPGALKQVPGWSESPDPPHPVVDPDALLNLQFTSGSTGHPKLVALSGRSLVRNAEWTARAAGISGDDRLASPLPLAHAAGLGSSALLALVTGAQWHSMRRFHAETVLDQIEAKGCTVLQAVPTMATLLADRVTQQSGRWDLSSLRLGFLGGAPCPPALRQRTAEVLGLRRVAVVYGQTEAGPTISVDPGDGSVTPPGQTVGRVLPQLRARVVDPGSDTPLPAGRPGELQVKGESVMAGYLDDEAATDATLTDDGWLATGDLGRLSTDRVFTLTGRISELIIRGGENISPAEVEAALLQEPSVGQAYVLAVPSAIWGEEVGALVAPAPGAQLAAPQIIEAAAIRLARHKVPSRVWVVDELPLLPSGKVDRRTALTWVTTEEER